MRGKRHERRIIRLIGVLDPEHGNGTTGEHHAGHNNRIGAPAAEQMLEDPAVVDFRTRACDCYHNDEQVDATAALAIKQLRDLVRDGFGSVTRDLMSLL
jgi:hypothetical protein